MNMSEAVQVANDLATTASPRTVGPRPHICVCICSYRRPELLQKLLGALREQETGGAFTFSIVIGDNDKAESAKPVASAFAAKGEIPIRYCVEPEQNIAKARNKVLQQASGDYIAFIDDDEFPERRWLRLMLDTCLKYKADGVLGPVEPHFEQEPPSWITKGRFYHRPRHSTGFVLDWMQARTGNLLFRRDILASETLPFLPEFGSGGEDRNFFMRMMARGHKFVWCDEAVAHEVVPALRWKRSFMLRRALLRGKMSLNHPGARRSGVLKSFAAVPLYSVALPIFLMLGQHHFMRYLISLCDHLGRILAFLGVNPIRAAYVTE